FNWRASGYAGELDTTDMSAKNARNCERLCINSLPAKTSRLKIFTGLAAVEPPSAACMETRSPPCVDRVSDQSRRSRRQPLDAGRRGPPRSMPVAEPTSFLIPPPGVAD